MKAADIEQYVDAKAEVVSLSDLLVRVDGPGRATWQDLPVTPGVYAVVLPSWRDHSFAASAGWAKHAKPTVPDLLRNKQDRILTAGPTDILYIGKASHLRKRVRQLARFGMGRARKHRGGEWLWQLDGIDKACVRMWCCSRGRSEPLERELLERFRHDHGDLPLANRN